MDKTLITIDDIEDLVDKAILGNEAFCFVVDPYLAEHISDYVFEEYDLIDECGEEDFEYEEYYVSSLQSCQSDPYMFFVESAKNRNGTYKVSELDSCTYFVFSDMDRHIAENVLQGGCIYFCKLDEDIVECEYEDDIPDEVAEIAHIIDEYANIIESSECRCHLRDVLLEVFFKGMRIGEQNYKDWLLESIQNND